MKLGILSVPHDQNIIQKSKITIIEGARGNLPDNESMKAAIKIKNFVKNLSKNDVLFCLITGGGSSLLSLPIKPITLDEKTQLIKKLSLSGATINELNVIRTEISQVKGGKLLKMARNAHQVISLIISDIIDDPLELIASGPTIPFFKSKISPLNILKKYKLMESLPISIAQVIKKNEDNQDSPETTTETTINNSQVFLIGNNRTSIAAAMNKAKSFELLPLFLSAKVQGDVEDVSKAFFKLATIIKQLTFSLSSVSYKELNKILEILHAQPNFKNELFESLKNNSKNNGICIVSSGEPTVKVIGDGLGGRNQELTLRFTKLIHDAQNPLLDEIIFLSCGTDGIDGNSNAAGGIGGKKILSHLHDQMNLSNVMKEFIFRNDSYNFYKKILNDSSDRYHVITGHTGTNVMDIQLLILPSH